MKSFGKILITATLLFSIVIGPTGAQAYKVNDNNEIYGYSTMWGILDENSYSGSSSSQSGTGDSGKDKSFGFLLKQARLGARGKMLDGMLGYNILADAAGANSTLAFVEGWVTVKPLGDDVSVNIGQFRPYGDYEVGVQSGSKIDNLDVFKAGGLQTKYFMIDSNNNTRDRGVELVVNKIAGIAQFKLSVTNGYGNNGDVGGSVSGSKAILSNGAGDAAYTAALIVTPAEGLRLNAGYGINKHDNAVATSSATNCTLGSDGVTITCSSGTSSTVADIDRTVFSAGGKYELKDAGFWVDAEYASLKAGDKDTVKPGYEVNGYYARAGYYVVPKALDIYVRYQAWNEISKTGATESKNTGFDINVRYHVGTLAFVAEYEKQDLDGTSNDPVRVALRTVLVY